MTDTDKPEKKQLTVLVPAHVMDWGRGERVIKICFDEKDKVWNLYASSNISKLEIQSILDIFHSLSKAVNYGEVLGNDDNDPDNERSVPVKPEYNISYM